MFIIPVAVTVVLGIAALVPTIQSMQSGKEQAEAAKSEQMRQEREEREKKEVAAGPPVRISQSVAYSNPAKYQATREPISDPASFGEYEGTSDKQWQIYSQVGATEAEARAIDIAVEGLHEGTVSIQGMRVTNRECEPPLSGTIILPDNTGGTGEEVETISIGFNLDEQYPQARFAEYDTTDQKSLTLSDNYFGSRKVVLEKGDVRNFAIFYTSLQRSCTFTIEMEVYSGGKRTWIPVGADGNPGELSVTALAESYQSAVKNTPTADEFASKFYLTEVPLGDVGFDRLLLKVP